MPKKKTQEKKSKIQESPSSQDDKAVETPDERENENNFPIVGIGASAGGLGAFEAFFSSMPVDIDPGMAFVLVQHLAPDHKSILTELVKRYTRMKVFEVKDGMKVEPNCAYIIPPNRDMAFMDGTLQLLEPSAPRGQRLPIDFFFRSLAHDLHERAICIVLSGTGSDGTLGVRAIKGEGGMVMAQNPESTEYDGMPRNAIGTGMVDFVMPPAEMPAQLMAYVSRAFGRLSRSIPTLASKPEDMVMKILIILRNHTGHDFSQYKSNTIERRIDRRMAVQQIESLEAYIKYLQRTPNEVDALFRDLLIGVTSFFRDKDAFTALEENIIPLLFEGKPSGSTIRVWSTGCSTGEEAYSIAILLQEFMEKAKVHYKLQVFSTDIDCNAIDTARRGIYPASIIADVSSERLERFFERVDDGSVYRIRKVIRDILVFSEQNVVKDPPFSKLDLISCRNMMIYMGSGLQKKLIPLFHYALVPKGFLFLGSSETIGDFVDLFSAVDRKGKLYKRRDDIHSLKHAALSGFITAHTGDTSSLRLKKRSLDEKVPLQEITERILLDHVGLVGVIVSDNGDIMYIHGRSGKFLEPASGEVGVSNILKMAREGLRRELITALHKVVRTKELVKHSELRVKTNGDFTNVNLTVMLVPPAYAPDVANELYLVIIEEAPVVEHDGADMVESPQGQAMATDLRIMALTQELRAKDEYLQTTTEQLQTLNEELRSSNEEMQSINEELQSTNEELETSKEELQSVNEELITVNSEQQQKVFELSCANNDMNNLLAGTGIGTIFVDHKMRIMRFTPTATQIINLIQSDVGRPVGHIVSNLVGYDQLLADVQSVLNTLIPKEIEVKTLKGVWYTMRILPYRTIENVIEGVVITFVKITGRSIKNGPDDMAKDISPESNGAPL